MAAKPSLGTVAGMPLDSHSAPRDALTQVPEELEERASWTIRVDWQPTELTERLWIGGTPDTDCLLTPQPGTLGARWSPSVHTGVFDAVVTCAASVGSAGTGVLELRAGFHDLGTDELPSLETVATAVGMAVRWHRQGKRVLVRCRAGLNRSGLVSSLALSHIEGVSFEQAVNHARSLRAPEVLCNPRLYDLGLALSTAAVFKAQVASLA